MKFPKNYLFSHSVFSFELNGKKSYVLRQVSLIAFVFAILLIHQVWVTEVHNMQSWATENILFFLGAIQLEK